MPKYTFEHQLTYELEIEAIDEVEAWVLADQHRDWEEVHDYISIILVEEDDAEV